MGKDEIILFDPDKPIAHYEKARELKKKTDKALNYGKIVPVAAFIIGSICVIYDPGLMAMMALFGLIFCVIAFIGCMARLPKMCLLSIPLGIAAAAAAALSSSDMAPAGMFSFLLASGLQVFAINAADKFQRLRELPGFPFFDASMDGISFAAMDRFGSDQFIDDSSLHEEKGERTKLAPIGEPSDDMEELTSPENNSFDEKIPVKDPNGKISKNSMVWDMEEHDKKTSSVLSDSDLFDL